MASIVIQPPNTQNANNTNIKTYVISFTAGPGSGKSTIAAGLYYKLKLKGVNVEFLTEYAKTLVCQQKFAELNNQYKVSEDQANILQSWVGKVQFLVWDSSLVAGLYYNATNPDNVSNKEKTQKMILDRYNQFNNIHIFLERGELAYEQAGRYQTFDEAKHADNEMKQILDKENIEYKIIKVNTSSDDCIQSILNFIDSKLREK